MIAIWKWNLSQLRRKIWVPIALYGLVGIGTAIAAWLVKDAVPRGLPANIGAEAVSTILQIMASSMLAVTTFSLSIMASAFGSAATGATPRAIALLKNDAVTQRVLATFVGAFIFSLTGLIGLQTGIYEEAGRFLLFAVTLAVLGAVVLQLVRWIGHLADYGRLADTIDRVETAAMDSLQARMAKPWLGGRPAGREAAHWPVALMARQTGYVQVIDIAAVQALAETCGQDIALAVLPGTFVHPGVVLARMASPSAEPDETEAVLNRAFAIATTRTFEQDPRFGILALTEIASRALSPAVNDPGTAIDILGRQLRILCLWQDRADHEVRFPGVLVPGLRLGDLMTDAFAALARDGAGLIEVQIRLQKTLIGLATIAPALFGPDARRQSARALALAEAALVLEEDRATLRDLHAELEQRLQAPQAAAMRQV